MKLVINNERAGVIFLSDKTPKYRAYWLRYSEGLRCIVKPDGSWKYRNMWVRPRFEHYAV